MTKIANAAAISIIMFLFFINLPLLSMFEDSFIKRLKAMPNAQCFSTGSIYYPIVGWIGPICGDWRHCDKNNESNLSKGYSCSY